MKTFIRNYYWIAMVLIFVLAMVFMYKAVDRPELIGAATDKYDIPDDVWKACVKYGEQYGISPYFLAAVYWTESNYKANAVNKAGTCFGVGQVKESVHRPRMNKLGVTNLFDPDQNIHTSADYFAELFEEYEDPALVLMIYHGESDAMWKAENGIVSNYAQTILDDAWDLEERAGLHQVTHFKNLDLIWENGVG